jgi:hypothetical protein
MDARPRDFEFLAEQHSIRALFTPAAVWAVLLRRVPRPAIVVILQIKDVRLAAIGVRHVVSVCVIQAQYS